MKAWNENLTKYVKAFREEFTSSNEKPRNLGSIMPFLKPFIAEDILAELNTHKFKRWIAYLDSDGKSRAHFQDELDDKLYISIHRRSEQQVRSIDQLYESLGDSEFCHLLSEMTGIKVSALLAFNSSICHLMGPGDFLREHTDYGPPDRRTKLAISLSFCKGWESGYGGITEFKWGAPVCKMPRFNEATIFSPHENSMHSVTQVSANAPLSRFTMTFHYI